ncbi:hypothetical protein [uncultured Bradyrhizobium sp.]|uniref:hypothetical protein n=1 Tax=uncultured Bradyrhizobium sp. TaxID=199684 RepID=UPI00262ABAAB|nr:hypothetical protein [uncultured Bradyrhizobium sp.]
MAVLISILVPLACAALLCACAYIAYRLGLEEGRQRGMSEAYNLYVSAGAIKDNARSKITRDVSSTHVAIGSTLLALASSAFLYMIPAKPVDHSLHGVFRRWQGEAWVIVIKYPQRQLREAKLYEDDVLVGPANSDPQDISAKGRGLYRLYKEADETAPILMFSSSDNTDPNTNGRKYRLE